MPYSREVVSLPLARGIRLSALLLQTLEEKEKASALLVRNRLLDPYSTLIGYL